VWGGGDVCSDDYGRRLRDGRVLSGIGVVLPERYDYSDLHDGGAELLVHGDGE